MNITRTRYGKIQNYKGLDGTLQVLKVRRELEEEIFNRLNITKIKVDNSSYNKNDYKQVLESILSEYYKSTN